MKKRTKLLSLLLICALAVAMILPGVPAKVEADTLITIEFTGATSVDSSNSKVVYSVDGEPIELSVTGTIDSWNETNKQLVVSDAQLNSFKLGTTEENRNKINISAAGTVLQWSGDNEVNFSEVNLNGGNFISVEVAAVQNQGNNDQGNNPGNDPGNDPGNNQQPEDPGMNFALQIRVGNITKVVTAEDNVIQVEEENLENLSFWVEEFRDLNDGTVIPLQNVGNNSGAQDAEGRNPLEVGTTERTEHQWVVNLQYHNEDDPVEENRNCPPFYYVNLTFISANYNGVKLDFSKKPDMYQDTVYPDKVDITGTTAESPAVTGVYYDADDFTLSGVNGTAVSSIAVTGGIPASAVTITGNTVKFNSGYYATIPLTITLANGTVGYLSVERLGMEIRSVHPGIGSWPNVLHGSQNGSDVTTASGANTYNVVAVFYYDGTKSYADYNVIANLTFADGHTETKVVSGFGEKASAGDGGATKGGDYLVWSGASADAMPTSVSCTAVKAGATGGSNFGGALFGAGKGVTKTKQGTEYK